MGGVWVTGDVITAARANQKGVLVDTGANINSATKYVGMFAYCTSSGNGFTADHVYCVNSAGSAWDDIGSLIVLTSAQVTSALGFTPENPANKGAANGYAGLNGSQQLINAISALSQLPALPANRVLLSNGSGVIVTSGISNATLAFLDATSSIQGQINAKQNSLVLGSTTLGANALACTVSGLPATANLILIIKCSGISALGGTGAIQFNGDTATNYNYRLTGTATYVSTGNNYLVLGPNSSANVTLPFFAIIWIKNTATERKVCVGLCAGGNTNNNVVIGGEWINIINQITSVSLVDGNSNNLLAGTTLTVLGFAD